VKKACRADDVIPSVARDLVELPTQSRFLGRGLGMTGECVSRESEMNHESILRGRSHSIRNQKVVPPSFKAGLQYEDMYDHKV